MRLARRWAVSDEGLVEFWPAPEKCAVSSSRGRESTRISARQSCDDGLAQSVWLSEQFRACDRVKCSLPTRRMLDRVSTPTPPHNWPRVE